jgi:hypothetical protein
MPAVSLCAAILLPPRRLGLSSSSSELEPSSCGRPRRSNAVRSRSSVSASVNCLRPPFFPPLAIPLSLSLSASPVWSVSKRVAF